jgi:hypothetical protein
MRPATPAPPGVQPQDQPRCRCFPRLSLGGFCGRSRLAVAGRDGGCVIRWLGLAARRCVTRRCREWPSAAPATPALARHPERQVSRRVRFRGSLVGGKRRRIRSACRRTFRGIGRCCRRIGKWRRCSAWPALLDGVALGGFGRVHGPALELLADCLPNAGWRPQVPARTATLSSARNQGKRERSISVAAHADAMTEAVISPAPPRWEP